jgi:hypothetical protein
VTTLERTLDARESRVLRVVADYQLSHGTAPHIDDVLLSFGQFPELVRDAVEVLVSGRYVERKPGSPLLLLSFRGLRSSGALLEGKVSLIAESLLGYIKGRVRREGTRFATYTWPDLIDGGVVSGNEDFSVSLAAIRILRLSGGDDMWSSGPGSAPSGTWSVPQDRLELLALNDINDIYERAERLRLLESPQDEEGTLLQISRTRLFDLQEALHIASKTRRVDGVVAIVREVIAALPAGDAKDRMRACQENLARLDLSDYARGATLGALAKASHDLQRAGTFDPGPAVDTTSYAKFLEATLREGRDLGNGMTISLAAIGKRARLDAPTLHAAAARSVDEDLTYFSDIDGQLYSIQVNDESDVSQLISELKGGDLRATASRSLPTVVNHFHGNVGAVAAAPSATAHGTVVIHQVDEALRRVIECQDDLGEVADVLLRLLRAARRLEREGSHGGDLNGAIQATEEFRAFQQALRPGLPQAVVAAAIDALEMVPSLQTAVGLLARG